MKKITISGVIGWDVTAADFGAELEAANGGEIEILVSSPGGLVSDALEMFNLLRNYPGQSTAILSGFAMSSASYIPLAADKVIAEDNAVFMIHNAGGLAWGDHNEILHYGDFLKGLSKMIANTYVKFTGKSLAEVTDMMDEETFFYGDEIVESGFAHEMVGSEGEQDQETNMSVARLKYSDLSVKMSADQEAMKQDLTRASAMALGEIKKAVVEPQNEDSIMDLKDLKAKHPELVAEITKEATAGHADAIAAARAEGVSAESDRIKSVHAQMFPGHEDIVNAAMFDGKSQAGDVAMQINAANIEAQAKAGQDLSNDAPPAVPEPAGAPPKAKKVDKNAPLADRVQAEWDGDEKIRAEFFGKYDSYLAFREREDESGGDK